MLPHFDRRVLADAAIELVRTLQRRSPCHLAGGAALAGAHLGHRLSADIDLFLHRPEDLRDLVRQLPDAARESAATISVVRDAGTFVRATAIVASDRDDIPRLSIRRQPSSATASTTIAISRRTRRAPCEPDQPDAYDHRPARTKSRGYSAES